MITPLSFKAHPNLKKIAGKFHLVNFVDLLGPAQKNGFAVAAINARTIHILKATLQAAWEEKSPIIIEIAQSESRYCGIPYNKLADWTISEIEQLYKEHGYMIPVGLHADHVKDDPMTALQEAINAGFTSLLCDQSHLDLEENINNTKQIVNKAHEIGISIEGEIGVIGTKKAADATTLKELLKFVPTVKEAVSFVSETRIDGFAGYFGNVHGAYAKLPIITWDRMQEISKALAKEKLYTPLVLHGSSYLETQEYDHMGVFKKAIEVGCHKVNYATNVSDILKLYFPHDLMAEMEQAADEPKNWRKQLGAFESKIAKVDSQRMEHAIIHMKYHIKMMLRHAFLSSDRLDLYNEDIMTR